MKRAGCHVCCLAVKHHADPILEEKCDEFRWIGPARIGQGLRWYRRHGVTQATMAGKFHKVQLYRPWIWMRFVPDWTTTKVLWPHFVSRKRDCKDDSLLGAVVDAFRQGGIVFQPATDFAPDLLVRAGTIAGGPLSIAEELDIKFGWEIAKEMGRLDIGQSVCIKERAVLAVEAIEGTDMCIRRAGGLCNHGSFTVVKVAKPQQDMRFDVPTIGVGTLQTMMSAGARVLAIESGRTILLDESEFREFARQHGISVVALPDRTVTNVAA